MKHWWILCICYLGLTGGMKLWAQSEEEETVYLVLLDLKSPEDVAKCYTDKFDKKKVKLHYAEEDTLNLLDEFSYDEEPLTRLDCFVPDLKLVFRDYTYVISLYCTTSLKYRNNSPFIPSKERIPNDLVFTSSLHIYLRQLRARYFGKKEPNKALLNRIITGDPLGQTVVEEFNDDWMMEEKPGTSDKGEEEELKKESRPTVKKGSLPVVEEKEVEEEKEKKPGS